MLTSDISDNAVRAENRAATVRDHWRHRAAAEARRSSARRELKLLKRHARRDLRAIRRQGETTVIVARSQLGVLALRSATRLADSLRTTSQP